MQADFIALSDDETSALIERIVQTTAARFGIGADALRDDLLVAAPRYVATVLIYELTPYRTKEIGDYFKRSSSTLCNAMRALGDHAKWFDPDQPDPPDPRNLYGIKQMLRRRLGFEDSYKKPLKLSTSVSGMPRDETDDNPADAPDRPARATWLKLELVEAASQRLKISEATSNAIIRRTGYNIAPSTQLFVYMAGLLGFDDKAIKRHAEFKKDDTVQSIQKGVGQLIAIDGALGKIVADGLRELKNAAPPGQAYLFTPG